MRDDNQTNEGCRFFPRVAMGEMEDKASLCTRLGLMEKKKKNRYMNSTFPFVSVAAIHKQTFYLGTCPLTPPLPQLSI